MVTLRELLNSVQGGQSQEISYPYQDLILRSIPPQNQYHLVTRKSGRDRGMKQEEIKNDQFYI